LKGDLLERALKTTLQNSERERLRAYGDKMSNDEMSGGSLPNEA